MTIQQSIIAAAVIIGASIVGARIMAPYQLASGGQAAVWRLNSITGGMEYCVPTLQSAQPQKCF